MFVLCIFPLLAIAYPILLQLTQASPLAQQPYPPYNYGIGRSTFRKRQASDIFITSGVHTGTGPNGSPPLRLEIRDLERDPVAWTLYILGLDFLQYTDQSEMLSWYQIAGKMVPFRF